MTEKIALVPHIYDALDGLSEKQKSLLQKGRIVSLGKFKKPGWFGAAEFLLAKCQWCKGCFVDYAHGFAPRQYLSCSCGQDHVI